MNDEIAMKERRNASDVYEDLDTKLRDINAFLDIMTTCDRDQCDVNGAACALQRVVEGAIALTDELYRGT